MVGTTTKKATVNKETKVVKEDKVMKKNEVAVVEKKAVAKKETKPVATKKVETKKVDNAQKVNQFISIEEVAKLYEEFGINCTNPECKGNYRIMASKSSLNLKPKKGYYIYTSDADYELITKAGLKNEDLIVEKGTNSQDKQRPNTVICTTLATLKALLAVYATNPVNKVA